MKSKLAWRGSAILLGTALLAAAPASAPPKQLSLSNEAKLEGGVEATAATAEDMALPREKFPMVHFAAAKDFFAQNQDRSKTPSGLYILDADFIPAQLPAYLKSQGLTLNQDGSLVTAKGQKTTMLFWPKLVKVTGKQGALPGGDTKWSLGLVPSAQAATPYPLSWVSAGVSWRTPSDFCRTVTDDVGIDAWGPLAGGSRPHTRIQSMEARIVMNHNPDRRCSNADSCRAHDEWFVGCFWPAYSASGWNAVHALDGSFSWGWTFRW